jgi:Tfp pilus assembly protein PilE
MQLPPDEFEISTVQDLDPEPPDRGRLSHTREVIAGLLLLLGVLAWAGWDAWQQSVREAHYHQAEQAAQRKDWDQALAHYQAASGYRDAQDRARQAQNLINERNRQYNDAVKAAQAGKWAAVLQQVEAVNRIQPGYRDAAELGIQAITYVAPDALAGSVALRADANPPGLYYHNGEGWVWLEGSDRSSRVLGYGTPDHIVYSASDGGPPVVATIQGTSLSFKRLAFEANRFDFFVWGRQGVWGLSSKDASRYISPPDQLRIRSGYSGYYLYYQAFDSPRVVPVTWSGPEQMVMDLGQDGRHFLLAVATTDQAGNPINRLYLADAAMGGHGDNNPDNLKAHLLYTFDGGFQTARLSPDNRYVLVVTFSPHIGQMRETHSAVLIDTQSTGQPLVITRRTTNDLGRAGFPAVSADFLTKGPLAGKAIIGEWGSNRSSIILLDPARPQLYLTRVLAKGGPFQRVWAMEYEDRPGVVLAWQNGLDGTAPYEPNITVVEVTANQFASRSAAIPLETGSVLVGTWLRDGYLLYRTRAYSSGPDPGSYTLYSVPLSELDSSNLTPTPIYEARASRGSSPVPARAFNIGPKMLVYTLGTEVHARTYDGSVDLSLDFTVDGGSEQPTLRVDVTGEVSQFFDPFYDPSRNALR